MNKILGIDTGTNSIGWAIVEKVENKDYKLLEYGTNIFQEGVKVEKGDKPSKAAERTMHRNIRKHYWRRKVRKIRLLTILIENNLCPPITKQELREWRTKKKYPQNELFLDWQRTEDKEDINPYHFRYNCLMQKLDMSDITQRYILGRALYHLNQRRGFLSNRKESTKESEGQVKQDISQLTADIKSAGCSYLGEYFYQLYQKGEKIRTHYTARNEHYLAEFHAICKKQELDNELIEKLEKAIFNQRPLKSQKQQVGKCTFETKKSCCPTSHPLFEDFRMYSFINNIRIQTPQDNGLRPLSASERKTITPLFLHKPKRTFLFEEIAKKLAGKNNYCYITDKVDKPYKFNYYMDTNVNGCPVNAQLTEIFGDNWLDGVNELYTLAKSKSRIEILNDIWHVLFFYDDEKKLKDFAKDRLQLNEKDAEKFSQIHMPQEYASLSLKAIKKILPYLKDYGLIYSDAVFLANLCEVLPSHVWCVKEMRNAAIERIIEVIHEKHSIIESRGIEHRIKAFLKEYYHVEDEKLKKLYHPSMIDAYPRQQLNNVGLYQLGSPRINSVRNPMAMHSLFRLRKVINLLLKERKIDEETIIHIEFSRELNNTNRRKAIQANQRNNEKYRDECRKKIAELYKEQKIGREPSDTDILKYQLWEEQFHKCLYTGDEISLIDFLGDNPKYDIEHTVPRSVGGDSTKMNLTLCQSKFNREIKKTKLPSQLANHEEILQRINSWKEEYEKIDKQIRKLKGSHNTTKEAKDRNIQRRHELSLLRDYWRGKYQRFIMTEVPEGFSRRQGTDISIISRYARLYLKSVFHHVYTVKGITTSDFRKIWGIQDEYTKKERINHAHHCIDAITVACIGANEYSQLAQYYHTLEDHEKYGMSKPHFPKPWTTFADDIKHIQDNLLVAHYTQDNMPKAAKRRIMTSQGKIMAQGDVARGSLHLGTYYGKIERDGEIKSVIRKPLNDVTNIDNIIDEIVKEKVKQAISTHGSLKKAVEAGIWMNEEKGIPIKKVRCFTSIQRNTLDIRKHRDISRHDYKQTFHVWNENNYMIAIYEGQDEKGRIKREFEEIKNIDAARYYRTSNDRLVTGDSIVPIQSASGYDLLYKLQIGTMVLLYENTPEEVWEQDKLGLQKRLYKVTGISLADGRMVLFHQQEARLSTEVIQKDGAFSVNEEFRSKIRVSLNQFQALIGGIDFKINDLGEIKRII